MRQYLPLRASPWDRLYNIAPRSLRWTAQHATVIVPFDREGDDPSAFFNANTLAELHKLEQAK